MSLFPFLSSFIRVPMIPAHISLLSSMPSLQYYAMDGPFKTSMNFLLRLAWTSKLQLPVLIAVAFMAFDIRLQLEINIFWEGNHRNVHNNQVINNERPDDNDRGEENVNGYAFLDQIIDAASLSGQSDGDELSTEYTSDDDDDSDNSVNHYENRDDSNIHSDVHIANHGFNSTVNIAESSDDDILSPVSDQYNLNHQSDDDTNSDTSSSEIKIVHSPSR